MTDQLKKCARCAEMIQRDARVCRFCKAKQGTSGTTIIAVAVLVLFVGFCTSIGNENAADREKRQNAVSAIPDLTAEQIAQCREILDRMQRDGSVIDRNDGVLRVRAAQWGELTRELQTNIVAGVACADHAKPIAKLSGIDNVVIIKDAVTGKVLASAAEGQLMFE